jgi:hypothetical protein
MFIFSFIDQASASLNNGNMANIFDQIKLNHNELMKLLNKQPSNLSGKQLYENFVCGNPFIIISEITPEYYNVHLIEKIDQIKKIIICDFFFNVGKTLPFSLICFLICFYFLLDN